jgi:glutathione S-transferase
MVPQITLYSSPPSNNAVRAEITLREKSLPFELVSLDLMRGQHKKPPLSELTPRQQVPTLVYETEQQRIVVYESIAIIRFLDMMHPEPPLLPAMDEPARLAEALMRIEEFQAKLDPKNIFGSVVFRKLDREALGTRVDELIAEIHRWEAYLIDRTFLAGSQFTLADIAVFPSLVPFELLGFDYAGKTPHLSAYLDRCKARESVQATGWLTALEAFVRPRNPAQVLS